MTSNKPQEEPIRGLGCIISKVLLSLKFNVLEILHFDLSEWVMVDRNMQQSGLGGSGEIIQN